MKNDVAHRRLRRGALAALVTVGCFFSACGSENKTPVGTVESFSLEVQDGAVSGDQQPEVAVGTEVIIEVTADVDDEVHVHGYDISEPVGPDGPATVKFNADIPGVFDVELESSGVRLMELTVE